MMSENRSDELVESVVRHEVLMPEMDYCCEQMKTAIAYGNIRKSGLYFSIKVPSGYDDMKYGQLGIMYCPFCGTLIYPLKNPETGEVYYKWQKVRK